jgi:ubiquinone biosynthesis protein
MATTLQRAYQNLRTGEAVFRDANRFRQILGVLVRHGFGALVQQLNLEDRWLLKKLLESRDPDAERLPLERRILLAIHDLGATFVKLGQILSTRADLLPPLLIAELKTLQNAVPPMPIADAPHHPRRARRRGRAILRRFRPARAGQPSIAQVHRARIKGTDTEVAVKVQRPDLKPQIEADLEIMSFLARALEASIAEARLYSPAGIVAQFEQAIRKEIDFTHEVEHLTRFRRNFAARTDVHFPAPHPALCTARVLTMEYIAGVPITAITARDHAVERVVQTGLEVVLQMVFADGFFHGDLHPGNLLVRDDDVLGVIDFGLCGRLTTRQRDLLVDMILGLASQSYASVARVSGRSASTAPIRPSSTTSSKPTSSNAWSASSPARRWSRSK